MLKTLIVLLLALPACASLGRVTEEATGIDWEWDWQLRVVCPDQSRVVIDSGTVCTDNPDAFAASFNSETITDEGWCGEPALRTELALDPVVFGAC